MILYCRDPTNFLFDLSAARKASSAWMEFARREKSEERKERENLLQAEGSSMSDDNDESDAEEDKERLSRLTKRGMNEAKGIVSNLPQGSWLLFNDKNDAIKIAYKGQNTTKLRRVFQKENGFSLDEGSGTWTSLTKVIAKLQDDGTLTEEVDDYESATDSGSEEEE